jgi:UDP-N-acetylmuramoylalanine--D-glutamate ligase
MKKSPDVALITNISPNHLDVHKSMEEYVDAKKNIFKYQTGNNKLILNFDNEITREFATEAKGERIYFSRVNDLNEGAMLKDGTIIYRKYGKDIKVVKADEILIPGVHNIENYLAATAATINYVEPETIEKTLRVISSRDDLRLLPPNRKVNAVHVAFRPNSKDILMLVRKLPELKIGSNS